MTIRAETLFTHDAAGRIVDRNSPEDVRAPRVFLGRTLHGDVLRFRQDVPERTEAATRDLVSRQPSTCPSPVPGALIRMVDSELGIDTPDPGQRGGPAYRFGHMLPACSDTLQLTPENVALACDTFTWLLTELMDWWPCFAVVRHGAAVSVCFSARNGKRAAEAGVETLPNFRAQGYATMATSAWAQAIRRSGRVPLYSTSWDHWASQGVARRLGLIMFGADVSWF